MQQVRSERTSAKVFGLAVAASILAHVGGYVILSSLAFWARDRLPEIITVEVLEPPQAPTEPEPVSPEPEAEELVGRVQRPEPEPQPIEEPAPSEEEPAEAPEPEDLTQMVYTNEGATPTWSMPNIQGPGADVPIRGQRGVPGGTGQGRPGGTGTGARFVAVASLARPPVQPSNMDALLRRYYPPQAKQLGIEGEAVVTLDLTSDGRVSEVRLQRETEPSYRFGQACIRALRQSPRWGALRDREGRPARTRISFTCSFEVTE